MNELSDQDKIEFNKKLLKKTYSRIPLIALLQTLGFYVIIYLPVGCGILLNGGSESDSWKQNGVFYTLGMFIIFYVIFYAISIIVTNIKTKNVKQEIRTLEEKIKL